MQIDGVLNLNKPGRLTSRRAVDRVRRLLAVRKAGHAGTLDPDATGVLIICLGKATKLFDALQVGSKEYEGTLRLGMTTDTLDASGNVLTVTDTAGITREQVAAVFQQFTGNLEQVPPMYSAVKHQGQPVYKLARRGIQIERPKRSVTIHALEAISINMPDVHFRVVCSKGTYVRVLADDIGRVLGCGAHLYCLKRTRSGIFTIDEAHTLEQLEKTPETAMRAVIPMDVVAARLQT